MKLSYFNARGLAETSRILLAVAQADYEDFRYPLKIIDWSTYSFERKEFDSDKASGKLANSLGKLPFLEVDGHIIPQSKAIERYLARKHDMMGSNEIDAAKIDSICEYVRDFKKEYQKTRALKGDEREEGMTKWFTETLSERLQALDVIVSKDFAVGESTSLADVTLYTFLTQFFDDVKRTRNAMEQTINIRSIVERVGDIKEVQEWRAKRPVTEF